MSITAVIFDYYETLAELPRSPRVALFDELAKRCGYACAPGEAYEDWRGLTLTDATVRFGGLSRHPPDGAPLPFVTFGRAWTLRFEELFQKWGVDTPPETGALAYRDAHIVAPLYSDARETLELLQERYQIAILSDADADFLQGGVVRNALDVETVVTSEDVKAYKPHITMFREVCSRLDVEPRDAVYVGDSPWADVAGARNAGMRAVWMNRHGFAWPDDIEPPDATITSLSELPSLLP